MNIFERQSFHTSIGVDASTSDRKQGVPVFVMLPLDTVKVCFKEGRGVSKVHSSSVLALALEKLKAAGVEVRA